jgi:hypothetical protein
MNQTQWLLHAADPAVRARIKNDPVLPLYGCIAAQFNRWVPLGWPDAVVGLHIVYGWTPTIPNLRLPAGLPVAGKARVVKLFNAARRRLLTAEELTFLKSKFASNSMVGLSKLLHFLAPDRYAIWDTRVATVWRAPRVAGHRRYNRPAAYLGYIEALHEWAPAPRATAIGTIRALSPHLAAASDLRILELVLFHV